MVPSRNIDIIDAIGLAYSLYVLPLECTVDTYTHIHAHTHACACTYETKKKSIYRPVCHYRLLFYVIVVKIAT